jgi:hypothetical protein
VAVQEQQVVQLLTMVQQVLGEVEVVHGQILPLTPEPRAEPVQFGHRPQIQQLLALAEVEVEADIVQRHMAPGVMEAYMAAVAAARAHQAMTETEHKVLLCLPTTLLRQQNPTLDSLLSFKKPDQISINTL